MALQFIAATESVFNWHVAPDLEQKNCYNFNTYIKDDWSQCQGVQRAILALDDCIFGKYVTSTLYQ